MGASRPRNKTAWPLWSLAASARADGQRRDVVQRGLNGQKRVGEAALAGRGSMAQSLQLFQRNHVALAERPDRGPPQRADMAETAEHPAEIAGERPHIGAFAAFGLEHGMVAIRLFDQDQAGESSTGRGASSTVSPSRARS